jgi:chemotaxis protein CheC
MEISAMTISQEHNALAEVVGIGFSRAADALSELTGYKVELSPPQVAIFPLDQLAEALEDLRAEEVASVHQVFSGPMAGDAVLVLRQGEAVRLARLLVGSAESSERVHPSDGDVLVEVGNIVLSACLGTFGSLLHVHVSFAVPRLHLESLMTLLDSLVVGADELRYGLVVSTGFQVEDTGIRGYLIVVTSAAAMTQLLTESVRLS